MASKIEIDDAEIIEALREEFSLNLTGGSYKNSANKEIINDCVRQRYSEFKKVLETVRLHKLNKSLENILNELRS